MEERLGFMTLRLNGDVEAPGGMSMTSTPTSQKVKRGYDSISEGGDWRVNLQDKIVHLRREFNSFKVLNWREKNI